MIGTRRRARLAEGAGPPILLALAADLRLRWGRLLRWFCGATAELQTDMGQNSRGEWVARDWAG